MKVAVINFSGNVGKSTTARHLLAPRIPGSEVIAVETINSDGTDDEAFKGTEFRKLMELLALASAAVVDVGASNVEDFIHQMKQFKGSHEDFDCFVVPSVPSTKQQRDTISTIDALSQLGIEPARIRLLFNQVDSGESTLELFAPLVNYHQTHKRFTLRPDAAIHTNELFELIKEIPQSISDLKDDQTDYREKIKTAESHDEKVRYSRLLSIRRLASGVNDELDEVFETLMA